METQDYMKARVAYIHALLKIDTFSAAQTALGHAIDLLRLSPSDYMEVRFLVPGLLLRLNKDQDGYDFIKWWEDKHEGTEYERANVSLP